MIGTTIDQYKIVKALGQSPEAEDFLAVQLQTGDNYHIKAISPALLGEPGFRERLMEDARRLLELDHPNVVPLTNVLDENGRLFMVREYVEGDSLHQKLTRLSKGTALPNFEHIFSEIAKGIGYVHSRQLTHRLLNPESVIITPDGHVKIIGFDQVLSKVREKRKGRPGLLMEASYFSPERFKNPSTTDIRANVYALGIMLFQMTTGKLPFRDKEYKNLYKRHAALPVPDPRSINPNITEAVSNIIIKSLAKKPEERYQTTVELFDEIIQATRSSDDGSNFEVLDQDQDEMDGGFDFSSGGGDTGFVSAVRDQDDDPFGFAFEEEPKEEDIFAGVQGVEAPKENNAFDFGGEEEKADDLGFSQPDSGGEEDAFAFDAPSDDADSAFGFDMDGDDMEAAFGTEASEAVSEAEPGAAPEAALGAAPEAATDEGDGFDFGLDGGGDEAAEDEFGFGSSENMFDSNDESTAGGDDFAFTDDTFKDGEPPVDAGGFDFGGGNDVPAAGVGDFDFGGGDDASAGDAGGFDFGADDPAPDGDAGGFDFGADDPAPASDAGGFDFGADDPAPADGSGGFDFGAEDPAPAGDAGGFDFGVDAPAPADDAGGFDFGADDSAPAGDAGGFDFGADDPAPAGDAGGFDFGSDEPAPAADGDGFDLGSDAGGGGDEFGFGSGSGDEGLGGFEFESEEDENQNNFDFQSLDESLSKPVNEFGDGDVGFDLSPEPEEENPFTHGGADPFDGRPTSEDEDLFGTSNTLGEVEDDPFADLREEATNQPAPEPPMPSPVAVPEPEAAGGSTDDGAFSWEMDETDDEPAGDIPFQPMDNENQQGMSDSLEQLERGGEPEYADESVTVKRVRKIDKKILGLTVALAVVVIAAIGFWYTSRQTKLREEGERLAINSMVESRDYDKALAQINTLLTDGPSSAHKQWLQNEEQRIAKIKDDTIKQVNSLLERASEHELNEAVLVDGKNDAYGAYMMVLGLDPANQKAREGSRSIRDENMARVAELVGGESELEALGILEALAVGDKKDKEVQRQYRELKGRLKEEEAGKLQEEIADLFAKQDYGPAVPRLKELEKIDPKLPFVKDTREALILAFIEQGQDMVAQQQFGKAETIYRNALELDPQNKQVTDALTRIGEERLTTAITRTQNNLDRAVARKNLEKQYQYAIELQELDPGNNSANMALAAVNKELDVLRQEAVKMADVGQFKEVARLYKTIYEIDGDEQTRALWRKYDRWSPPPGMAYIPKGMFAMGNSRTAGSRPQHDVMVSAFFIDKYEVTNREYKEFVDANPQWSPSGISSNLHDGNYLAHWAKGSPKVSDLDLPVTYVSWHAASAYAKWRNKRLPSEAEWEKAAAGNTKGQKYWWGNYSDAKSAIYEFYPEKRPGPVGSFPSNKFGIHEILGNVNEWVIDTYSTDFYEQTKGAKDPVNSFSGPHKVFRGGSFKSRGEELVLYLRYHQAPELCHATVGFRCAKDADMSL